MTRLLQVSNISLTKGKSILKNISCEVRGGEILTVLGPSGSGKSSLLRCLNRLESIGQGEIFLNGVETRQIKTQELRRRVGMLFQTPSLLPLTVSENLMMGPKLRGETMGEPACRLLLEKVGLKSEFLDRQVETLSVGEKQRAALAQVLANHPEALLLDEPTSALDPPAVLKIEELIKAIHKDLKVMTLLVTHNVEQALRFDAQTLVLVNGEVAALGNIRDLVNNPENENVREFFSGETRR